MFGDVANLQPVIAIAMFGGFFFARRWLALVLVAAILIVTDWVSGAFGLLGPNYPWQILAVTYLALMFPALLGRFVPRDNSSFAPFAGKVALLSILSSLVFFTASNWVFWQFIDLYPRTWAGLGQSYVAGLPFLRTTLASGLGFSLLLFSTWYALAYFQRVSSFAEWKRWLSR